MCMLCFATWIVMSSRAVSTRCVSRGMKSETLMSPIDAPKAESIPLPTPGRFERSESPSIAPTTSSSVRPLTSTVETETSYTYGEIAFRSKPAAADDVFMPAGSGTVLLTPFVVIVIEWPRFTITTFIGDAVPGTLVFIVA